MSGISGLPQCRGRAIKALAVDPEGVSTLLPRYLAPAPLPPALAARAAQVCVVEVMNRVQLCFSFWC